MKTNSIPTGWLPPNPGNAKQSVAQQVLEATRSVQREEKFPAPIKNAGR